MPLLRNATTIFQECQEILRKKNNDYAGKKGEYSNFETAAQMGLTTTEVGILVRAGDKYKRICNLMTQEVYVTEESIEDTTKDLINYLVIFLSYRKDTKTNGGTTKIPFPTDKTDEFDQRNEDKFLREQHGT